MTSLAVKNNGKAGVESIGLCHYKATNGIKRHLAVDILAFLCLLTGRSASVCDDQGPIELFTQNIGYFTSLPLYLPKITILVDNGYHPNQRTLAWEQIYPEIMTKIPLERFELAAKPSTDEKAARGQSRFISGSGERGNREFQCLGRAMQKFSEKL